MEESVTIVRLIKKHLNVVAIVNGNLCCFEEYEAFKNLLKF